jgi:peptidyl-prolyl cis-trans isomerase A (cyclophilin A)
MTRSLLSGLAIAFTISVVATAEVRADPAPAELSAADTAKLVAFFDKLTPAIVANKDDCAKMAGAIDGLVTANAPMLRVVMKEVTEGKALPKDAEAKLTERMAKAGEALEKCMQNPAVVQAMKRVFDPDQAAAPSADALAAVKAPVAADLDAYSKGIPGKGGLLATFKTPIGTIKCQLLADKAPMTVANFVGLATGKKAWIDPKTAKVQKNKPFYDGLIFHRVIPGFMIQGGDPMGMGTGGPGYTFGDETLPDVTMAPGTLAMANSGPSTNGSQFFITEGSPDYLNGKHTIFGRCKPIDIVTKIGAVKRTSSDKPDVPVTMQVTISHGTL